MSHLAFWLHSVWHPLQGAGYQFWSGFASDLSEITLLGCAAGWAKHHNCHEKRCWRIGHAHPEHGRPVCHRHFHRKPNLGTEGP